jgi:predicted glutamine amidotransferase
MPGARHRMSTNRSDMTSLGTIDEELATTMNGDGFGVGWYGDGETPRCITARTRLERPQLA